MSQPYTYSAQSVATIPQTDNNVSESGSEDSGSETSGSGSLSPSPPPSPEIYPKCARCEDRVYPGGFHSFWVAHCETCGDVIDAREERDEKHETYVWASAEYYRIMDMTIKSTADHVKVEQAKKDVMDAYMELMSAKRVLQEAKQASSFHLDDDDTDTFDPEDDDLWEPESDSEPDSESGSVTGSTSGSGSGSGSGSSSEEE